MHLRRSFQVASLSVLLGSFAGNVVSAQTRGQSNMGARTEILFLGTAGGPPIRVDRSEPATLLIVDGREYLIDCGIGTMRRLAKARIDSEKIKTIFFTHLHADHDLGLAAVMANDYLERPAGAAALVDVYGPPQTKELVNSAFAFISIGFRPFAAEQSGSYLSRGTALVNPFVGHEIVHGGLVFQDDKIRVTAFENSHYALMPARFRERFRSYSYRIATPHGVIVFTGDTGPAGSLDQFAQGADVLIAEASYRDAADLDAVVAAREAVNDISPAGAKAFRNHFIFEHLDASEIGQLASKARVGSVILYHYNPHGPQDQAAYVEGVKRRFAGPVFAPDDLSRYCMDRSGLDGSLRVLPCGSGSPGGSVRSSRK